MQIRRLPRYVTKPVTKSLCGLPCPALPCIVLLYPALLHQLLSFWGPPASRI